MHPKNDIIEEKQVLASFISKLPEAIIICDAGGSILLYDSQSETYLLSGKSKPSRPVTGKPITSFIDKNLIEHALDEINEQLKQHAANMVSTFILEKHNLILQAQVVPVLSQTGLFSGFVLILNDITQQSRVEKRVESLLKTLSKNARSPMASIRAAIEAMKEFPHMDENRQRQFIDIIHEESIILSDILNNVSDEYTNLINVKKSLKHLFIMDLMQTVSRRARDKLGIICHIKRSADVEQILIKADPQGPTCHTGSDTCFNEVVKSNDDFLYQLEEIISDRKNNPTEKSYTASLFQKGINKIAQKVGEEATEVVIEAIDNNRERLKEETADLLYHLIVLLAEKDISLNEINEVLRNRHSK